MRSGPDATFRRHTICLPAFDGARSYAVAVINPNSKEEAPDERRHASDDCHTTAVVNALPLPPAFRACSIFVIEISSLVMRECCPLNPGKNPSFLLLVEV
jgi:hypothetical protein